MSGVGNSAKAQVKKEPSGCHNCSQRRIKCDRTKPQCEKCLRKGLKCPGYGVRYRFNHGVASRGKFAGRTAPVDNTVSDVTEPEKRPALTLLWPDGTTNSNRDPSSPALISATANFGAPPGVIGDQGGSELAFAEIDSPEMPIEAADLPAFVADAMDEAWTPRSTESLTAQFDLTTSQSTYMTCGMTYDPRPYHSNRCVPASLELIDSRTRELFHHFSSTIAPVMVVVDSKFNGYRNLILPLACEDELVKAAVCVASLYYLAHQQPEMQYRADLGFRSILRQLRQRTSSRTNLVDISAWTTIIILLTGETITGGTNLPYLFKILQYLAAANTEYGRNSVMHSFLAEQTRMMTLFAQPLLEEGAGAMTLIHRPEEYFDFVSNMAIFQPALAKEIEIYKSAIHSACNIYIARATINPPHSETVADLDRLKMLCEQIQSTTPGHHTLVWVYFIAASESSTLEHRQFFTMRLREVFSRTGFHNIPAALAALQEFWKVQSERRWTEILPEVMPVFII